jgi:hypothetical protein
MGGGGGRQGAGKLPRLALDASMGALDALHDLSAHWSSIPVHTHENWTLLRMGRKRGCRDSQLLLTLNATGC